MTGTQTVTVVFTDLVGSTALLSRVGEERAEALRREHFGILRDGIALTGCREVKNLGDGLMIVAESAAQGAAYSVAIQQAFELRNRRADEPLLVRVGISLGDADIEDDDYFGRPVVEAARLCAGAEGGEILAADVVRHLAGTRSGLVFEPVGPLDLKGLDQPVETSRVVWTPVDPLDDRPDFPTRLEAARSDTFVGRGTESEGLLDAWKTVEGDGRHCSVLLSGEPGIGKTALAARFAFDVFNRGAIVVYGRCDEDLGIPYQPWIEALTHLVEGISQATLAAHVADRGAHLARLVPQLARRLDTTVPPSTDSDAERFVLYGCVTDLLARVSVQLPVLVVLDDLHWADRPSLQLLRHVVTAEPPMRVEVLGTFRDSDISAGDPLSDLLAALHRDGCVERIALTGLNDLDVLSLLEVMAGHEMDDQGVALRDALIGETGGNPFFVGEILRHLAETGAIFQGDDGRWSASADLRSAGLPVSVRELIGGRLARLGIDSERILALASVIGRDFDLGLLSSVAHVDEDALIDLCDAAVANQVLQTTESADRYTFAHALIEHTVYDSLSPARRARAHGAVAQALEAQLGADPGERAGELAYHWAAAVQPADTAKAVRYAQLAGDRALYQLAPDEAVRWYTQALELLGPPSDDRHRAELLVGLGDAQRQCGIAAHRETLLEASDLADAVGDVDLLVRAVLNNNRGYVSSIGDVDHQRIAAIDRALERVGVQATSSRARLLALRAAESWYLDLAERVALAEEALGIARGIGDSEVFGFAVTRTFASTTHPSTLAMRGEWIDEALRIISEVGDAAVQYQLYNGAWIAALERGDGPAIDEHFIRGGEIAARIPHTYIRFNFMYHQAWPPGLRGDLAEYERRAEAALAFGMENGEPDSFTVYSVQLAIIRSHQGRLQELIPPMEQAFAETPAFRAYRAGIACAKARDGFLSEAGQMLAEERSEGFPMPADVTWSTGMGWWIEAAALVGDTESAPDLRAKIIAYHDQISTTTVTFLPALSHYLGLLDHLAGRYDDAERWFGEALEIHEHVRSPILVARTHASWAALLADRARGDDRSRARTMAQSALDTAAVGGYGYTEADARAVLERLS